MCVEYLHSLILGFGKVVHVSGNSTTPDKGDIHCSRFVGPRTHLPFDMGGHCDMAPFTYVESSMNCKLNSVHVNGVISQ